MKPTLLLKLDNKHYTPNKAMSYPFFMYIGMGGRGIGKTTGWLVQAMTNYIKRDEEFIYSRRYIGELKTMIGTESITSLYDGLNITPMGGDNGYIINNEDNRVGYFLPLSKAENFKSTRFDKVTLIIYDECIIHQTKTRRYIKDEVLELLNFISTVQRSRTNLRVVLLCNNNDMFNPFFSFFEVPLMVSKKIYYNKKKRLLVEISDINPELLKEESKTGLFSLTEGTKFHKFHYQNETLGMKQFVIVPNLPYKTTFYVSFKIEKDYLSISSYIDKGGEVKYYVDNKFYDNRKTFILAEDGEANYFYGNLYKKRFDTFLKNLYSTGRLIFASQRAGDLLLWIFENVG